jgi:hypothetical protein
MKILETLFHEMKAANKTVYWNTSKSELMLRCPHCGDSRKDLTHTHFYIENEVPYKFYCQRCESKGVLNSELLKDLEVDDSDLAISVRNEVRSFFKNTNKTSSGLNVLERKKELKYPKYEIGGSFDKKLNYLNMRFGRKLDKDDLRNFKVVNSLEHLLILNKLEGLFDNEKFYNMMTFADKNGVCFLSSDLNYALFRYTTDKFERRYITISLNYPYDIGHKVYSIKNSVSIFEPKVNLVMAEGMFDINSVYLNYYKEQDNSKKIFYAANGKAFKLIPLLVNRMGFLNIDLDIYSDNDVQKEDYKYLLDSFRFNKIMLHYNKRKDEKDFGVPENRIDKKTLILK